VLVRAPPRKMYCLST